MKFIINILFIMSIFIITQSFADSFKSKRAEAFKDYNNGDVTLAFKKLKALSHKKPLAGLSFQILMVLIIKYFQMQE